MSFQDSTGAPDTPELFRQPDDLGRIQDTDLNTSLFEQAYTHAEGAFMGGVRGLYGIRQKELASGRLHYGFAPVETAPELSPEDAAAQVKQEGLEGRIKLPADQSIRKPVLDLMINDAHEDAEREAAISRGPQGFWPSALGYLTEIGVGIFDPVNAAAFSVPVIGEARYGAMLARAGESYLRRGALATAKGAAQGAVGGAAMAPFDWWGHTLDGQDYTMADALRSVALGAGMGAVAHGIGSAIGDVRARVGGRPLPGSPEDLAQRALRGDEQAAEILAKIKPPPPAASAATPTVDLGEVPGMAGPPHPAETLAELPESARADVTRAAVADVINGQPVRAAEMLETAAQQDPRLTESVMGPPRIETGLPHVDAILHDPETAVAIANPRVNREQDVPYTAGPDNEGNGLNIDRHFPKSFTVEANGDVRATKPGDVAAGLRTFDPAEPLAAHEFPERHAMKKLIAAGMDQATAYKVAHTDVAEVAEGQWYKDHDIDKAKAESAYQPYINQIEHEKLLKGDGDVPANLFKKPYPKDNVNVARGEHAPVEKPTAEESAKGREILAPTERAPVDRAAATEEAQRQTIAQRIRADLIAAGRSEEEATHLANIEAANIVTTARQFEGRAGTAQDVYEREHAGFRQMEAPTAQAGQERFQRAAAPPFYSAVERAVTSAKQDKASPEQWLGMLKNMPGVKAEELQWLGLEDWLKQQKGPVTKVFKNADASTGLHELGHMWLERFIRYSARDDAPESMRTDRATILRELGADHPDNITDEQHEQFARWVEQYVRTGDAPSSRLAGAFAKFREWLLAIYRTMRRLGSPISDDMRGVMDRLLATPEETAEYRALAMRDRASERMAAQATGETPPHLLWYQGIPAEGVGKPQRSEYWTTNRDLAYDYAGKGGFIHVARDGDLPFGMREKAQGGKTDSVFMGERRQVPTVATLPRDAAAAEFEAAAEAAAPETIGAPAHRIKGKVYTASNHLLALEAAAKDLGVDTFNLFDIHGSLDALNAGDGFVTSRGRFVTREEARDIAQSSGQGKATADTGIKKEDLIPADQFRATYPDDGHAAEVPARSWEDLAKRPDPDPDLTEASRAADRAPEPASVDSAKAPSAAEKMAAEVEKSWRDMEAGYSEEERALVNNALTKLDDDNAGRLQMIKDAAACLMAAGA